MIYNVFSLLLLCCWCITEVTVCFFLINGISDLPDLLSFMSAYGLSILIVYLIVNGLIKHDNSLGKTMITEALMKFLVFLAVIPLAGPVVSLFIVLFFRLYPLYPVRVELFDRVDKDILAVLKKRYEGRAIPALEAFLLRGMNADQALRLISRIDEMEWTVMKAVILRNIIRLAFRENMVLMAIDILTKKLDQILADINIVESAENTDARTMHRLANLYHEIPYQGKTPFRKDPFPPILHELIDAVGDALPFFPRELRRGMFFYFIIVKQDKFPVQHDVVGKAVFPFLMLFFLGNQCHYGKCKLLHFFHEPLKPGRNSAGNIWVVAFYNQADVRTLFHVCAASLTLSGIYAPSVVSIVS